jgi:hypothetical protein
LLRDALISFSTEAGRPIHRGGKADLVLPFPGELGEEVGEDIAGARAVGPVHDDHIGVRQVHSGIQRREPLVVPLGDASHEDVHQGVAIELKLRIAQAWEVVGHHHRT